MMKIYIVKSIFFFLGCVIFFCTNAQKKPVEVAKGFEVEIQTSAICEMCQYAIEYDLTFAKGVKSAVLNLETKVVTVVYNPAKINADKIRKRIAKVGYHADSVRRDPVAYEKLPSCCKNEGHVRKNQ